MSMRLIDRIKYSKDTRIEIIFDMMQSTKDVYVYGANRAAAVRIKLLREYGIEPVGCLVDPEYYSEGKFCEGLEVYNIDKIELSDKEVFIGFEDIKRAREVVGKFARQGIKVYHIEDPLRFKDMSFDFLLKNMDRYERAYGLLEDKLSKDIFVAAINGRIAGESEELAKYKSDSPYDYDFELLNLNANEIFVDCGAYDGDTILNFITENNGKYNHIFAFEADEKNADKIARKNLNNVDIIRKVVGDKNGTVRFYNDGSMFSNVMDSDIWGNSTRRDLYGDTGDYVEVPSCKIDDELKGKK